MGTAAGSAQRRGWWGQDPSTVASLGELEHTCTRVQQARDRATEPR